MPSYMAAVPRGRDQARNRQRGRPRIEDKPLLVPITVRLSQQLNEKIEKISDEGKALNGICKSMVIRELLAEAGAFEEQSPPAHVTSTNPATPDYSVRAEYLPEASERRAG